LTCIFSGERTALTTKYPFLISAFAVYSPSPEDEPVTMATGLFSAFAGITFCCDDAARATTARPPRRVGVAARLPEDPFLAVVIRPAAFGVDDARSEDARACMTG
jgi:hypothetical protein